MALSLPDTEVRFTEAEQRWIGFEPTNYFPQNQNSYYGEVRKTLCDQLQDVIDLLDSIYVNLIIDTADENFIGFWEAAYGIPVQPEDVPLEVRRQSVKTRVLKGAFTRPKRNNIIERYILAVFGESIRLTPNGVNLVAGGVPLHDEPLPIVTGLELVSDGVEITVGGIPLIGDPLFNVLEYVGEYRYEVRIVTSITPDVAGIERDLLWATFAPVTFTMDSTDDLFTYTP